MNQWEEFHLLRSDYLINYIRIVLVTHVHEVLVRCYEWFVTQLCLQIYTESFYSIAHGVGSLNSWKILQEFRGNSHFWWLLSVWIVLLRILLAITVVICHALVVAQTASCLRLASISVATNLPELSVLPLS